MKSWKKRLFVLDSEGLSYYKTEQVHVCMYVCMCDDDASRLLLSAHMFTDNIRSISYLPLHEH